MLDESGVKAMPSISAPNSGSLQKIRKLQVAKLGKPKKILEKTVSNRSNLADLVFKMSNGNHVFFLRSFGINA